MREMTIEDFRLLARPRFPRSVFDYIDGASGDEVTLRPNWSDFESIRFRSRVLASLEEARACWRNLQELDASVVVEPVASRQLV
jgi:isopentenyl diphosphate isomerase/L-lactate dehydrogenase-like FMN-dependent dehydrogenase